MEAESMISDKVMADDYDEDFEIEESKSLVKP